MDPTYPLVPIANVIAFFLCLAPLLTGLMRRSWNVGVIMYALWVAVESLTTAVNTIVWSDNVKNVAPVWCDITTHLDIGSTVGIPACSLVITRRLYKITRLREMTSDTSKKNLDFMIDLGLCVVFPAVIMGLYYIVQFTRFMIWEEVGCVEGADVSGLYLLVIDSWSVLFPLTSVIFYCPRILWVFVHQRREMNEFLDSGASVNRANYYRILALGCLDILITLPIQSIDIVTNFLGTNAVFYPGWNSVHSDWSPIFIPAHGPGGWAETFWRNFLIRWDEWIRVLLASIFFLLFGFTKEARKVYMTVFWSIISIFGFKQPAMEEASNIVFGSLNFAQAPMGTKSSSRTSRTSPSIRAASEILESHSSNLFSVSSMIDAGAEKGQKESRSVA